MNLALEQALEVIAAAVDRERVQTFTYWFTFALGQSDARYQAWRRKNRLDDLQPESVIALARARIEAGTLIPIAKWFHCACIVREGRELRRVRAIAAKFQPARVAAE